MERALDAGKQADQSRAPSRNGGLSPAEPRVHPILQLQAQVGNQAIQAFLRSSGIQAKMAISSPGDPEEREADAVAERVMGSSLAIAGCSCGGTCDSCKGQPVSIQRQATAPGPKHVPSAVARVLSSPGRPLDATSRAFFEPRFGRSFDDVRVHTDREAQDSARSIHAHAYASGEHLVFAQERYAPHTDEGKRLLAHELTHVAQQTSGKAPPGGIDSGPGDPLERDADRTARQIMSGSRAEPAAVPLRAHSRFALQRDSDTGSDDDSDVPEFDPQEELKSKLAYLDAQASTNSKLIPQILRLKLLLQKTGTPDWPDFDAFDKFYDECEKISRDEDQTIDALGADLNDADNFPPEAFPHHWSAKLKAAFEIFYPIWSLRRDVDSSHADLEKTGRGIPPVIFDGGLPLDFEASLSVKSFGMVSPFGVAFGWAGNPGGFVDPGPGPMSTFTSQAIKYLQNLNELDFITLWKENSQSVVQQVDDGDLSVDPKAFATYTTRTRPQGIPVDSIEAQSAGIPEPLGGRIDPGVAEVFISQISGLGTFGRSFLHAKDVVDLGNQFIAQADAQVAGENAFARVGRAESWGHTHGFYSEALLEQVKDIWNHKEEIAKSMGKDILLYTALEAIPGVAIITGIYLGLSLLKDAADTLGDIESADEEARNARTAAQLQKAAADKAKALSSAARKAAEAIAMHYATKAVKYTSTKVGGKVDAWMDRGETTSEPSKSAPADDPARAKEQAREQAKEEAQKTQEAGKEPGDPTSDRVDGELSDKLEDSKGDARITAQGQCKICHSPCRLQMDMARDVLRDAESQYRGYAENLADRVRLLNDAMESAVRNRTPRTALWTRFGAAFRKISREVDSTYQRIVAGNHKARNPALDEIDGFGGDEHGIMDDTKPRWDPEKAHAGTSYHDKIKARVLKEMPHDSIFTEDTIQDYLRRQGVDPKYIPKRSTGIDLFVLDNARNVFVPVDITSVAGGRAHVRKLHADFAAFKEGVERTGMHVTDPIEIEYIGKTFDEAAASIVAELSAYAQPPAGRR